MGSIAAILTRQQLPNPAVLARMFGASPHRGTEVCQHVCGNAIVGVSNHPNRLDATIVSVGEMTAALAGRLHNVPELTKALVDAGFPPSSSNPADVVLATIRAFGPDGANRLRGDFAAIVTDGRRLWCVRDQLGRRPLFYRTNGSAFFAATEAKQILAGAELGREPNLEVLERIFYARTSEDLPSAYQGVSRVPKMTTLAVHEDGTVTSHVYWHPERLVETARITAAEVHDRFTELFDQAVARCLTGCDVVSLSGGIDSPAVAAFAADLHRRTTGEPFAALSMVFPHHPKVDERRYIEAVRDSLGLQLHTFTFSARAWDDLEDWCKLFDGPIPTINVPQLREWYGQAARLGFTNMLTGELAETVVDLSQHLPGHLLLHGRWSALARLLATQRKQGKPLRALARQLVVPLVPARFANWYVSVKGRDFPQRIPAWVSAKKVNEVPYRKDLLIPSRRRWAAFQTLPLRGAPISMEAGDICMDMCGVTIGRPFADIDLWEFFLSLPAEIKYPDQRSKTLLRSMLRGRVPDLILDRRDKTLFNDHVMSQIDYPTLRRYLINPRYRMPGIDYDILAAVIERQNFTLFDWVWANDLVRIHAFMNQW